VTRKLRCFAAVFRAPLIDGVLITLGCCISNWLFSRMRGHRAAVSVKAPLIVGD
jgi:hypothetical protein